MPRKAKPQKSPAHSSSRTEKKKPKAVRNHQTRRAPDHEQELIGLLKLIKPELTDRPGWMALRYALLYRGVGGRFYGVSADIRLAAVRILDALRLLYPDYFPDHLRELDVLSDEQLKGAYPVDHEIWKLDLSCFANNDWAVLDLQKLGKLLARCIDANFRCVKCYVQREGAPRRSRKPMLLADGDAWRYMKRALDAKKKYSHQVLTDIPVPGWGERCLAGWLVASECQPEEGQLLGLQDASYLRLVMAKPTLAPETCAKGGRRVKI